MRNNKANYLIFMLTILVLHTIVLSYWLSKEVNKSSLNVGKKNNSGKLYREIIPAMQLHTDTLQSKENSFLTKYSTIK
jgi:hydrogenase-4 membrane subunit HyfE